MLATTSELRSRIEAALQNRIPRALTPPQRTAPELMPTGLAAVDTITGGIPLGCLTEICGPASSGRTSVLLAAMAECMRRGEICALVDASDAFDPQSAANAGVDLNRLLWVRCKSGDRAIKESGDRVIRPSGEVKRGTRQSELGVRPNELGLQKTASRQLVAESRKSRAESLPNPPDHPITRSPNCFTDTSQLEQALKTTDLLLQAGGFGLIVLDIADVAISAARRIPLTTWFRFRRAIENTSTALIVFEQHPHAKSCASLVMDFAAQQASWSETGHRTPVTANGISVETGHAASLPSVNDGVAFRVTSEGVVIPFETATTSFQTPQRWNTSHARLLNTVHVRLQVTRSRIDGAQKFPAQPERAFLFEENRGENTKDTKETKVM